MTEPTDEQKAKLIDSFDAMDRDQWVAMVRWMIDRIVADDQQMAATIIWREAKRRNENANKFQNDEKLKWPMDKSLAEVLREVGAKMTVA